MSVSAASDHSCAVLSDGKVECWGTNDYGQLGNGTTTNSATPVQVSGITTAVQVSAGEGHTCAVLGDQTVRCWGADYSGQLGNGATPTDITTPVEVEGAGGSGVLSGVTQVSAGDGQTCAVLGDHTVRCWGDDSDGELGDGNFGTFSSTPVKVLDTGGALGSSLGNVAQVSAGTSFTCAVLSTSGWVYCWGFDGDGDLGDSSTGDLNNDRLFPVRAGSITGAGDVSAGYNHACAVTGGAVWCWGYDEDYELGDNTTGDSNNDRLSPVRVVGASGTGFLGNATRVGVADYSTCALLSDGSIDCWGVNRDGQVGDNSAPGDVQTPARVSGISTATEVSGGSNHVCALLSDHSVRCWGDNFYSQLGIGKIGHSEVPVSVSGIADAIGLSSGADHACAIRTGGTVWCWGENDYGQLGNGATTDSSTPVQATGISGATQVSAGMEHTCALVSAGKVWCWGDDDYGQLGDGTSGDSDGLRMTPVEVEEVGGSGFLTGVTKISSGGLHTCALITGGTVDCWGNNNDGELGNGLASSDSSTPVSTGITAAIDISAGNNHACAVLTDHTVRCWGWDFHGQLGDGTTGDSNNDRLSPVEVDTASSTPLTGAVSVSAGWFHSCAVLTGGKVDCWGLNTQGQLGNSNKTNQLYAVQVNSSGSTPQIGVTAVSVGQSNSCALIGSAVECWGGGSYGQLGNGSEANSDNPTPVSSLSNVAAVSTGGDNEDAGEFACAIITGGTVECWGTDYYGELGDGGIGGSFVPVAVVGLP
jgi:alpha-tubulin suppressor-like RCC1 family protein